MPVISVITPTYNRGYLIGRAIESVLAQTFTDFELIIVDDCSSDETPEIVSAVADPRVSYVRLPENRGANFARAHAVRMAKGEYCAFLDSDDYWAPHKLETQLMVARSASSEHMVVSCDTHFVMAGEIRDSDVPPLKPGMPIAEYIFAHSGNLITSTLFMPTQLLRSINFDPSVRINQEIEMLLRMEAENASFVRIDEPLCYFDISRRSDRVSYTPHLLKESEAWFARVSKTWSPKARAGYYMNYLFDCAIKSESWALARRSFFKGLHWHHSPQKVLRNFVLLLVGNRGRAAYQIMRRRLRSS